MKVILGKAINFGLIYDSLTLDAPWSFYIKLKSLWVKMIQKI